ncbi:MAG: hypothetical protein CFH39_00491 [Alphaproteobacteria bacterium MarineAlpha10_Bin2]|nr:MAG: hypothetical protein CFH39_00491 [Alphaproteobacteria bacterium MarineAlpha10_Bin2]HIM46548.1 hypothetical protein [Alphaproteobacteria bacterium]
MAAKKKATSTKAMLARLDGFSRRNWRREPGDVTRLRKHKLPPMGNFPGVFYANFNTFWLGENIQVVRQLALDGDMDVKELNRMAAALLNRHAGRLAKWKLINTVKLVKELAAYFAGNGPRSHAQIVAVTEATMLAMDRVNTWIDAMIPWSDLDAKLKLNRAPK